MKKTFLIFLSSMVIGLVSVCVAAESRVVTTYIPPTDTWGPKQTTLSLPVRQHPFLFLNAKDFQRVRERATSKKWAGDHLARIKKEADAAIARPFHIPKEAGEWSHHYVCKTCGIKLKEQQGKHICPRCGKQYTGWPYDGVAAGSLHHQNIGDAQALGLAYQLTGNTAYADRCRQILLGYADRYNNWPIHDFKHTQTVKGARLFAQTLDESVFLIPLVWAYDLIYNSPGTTPAHRAHIENDLFRPAALVIRRNDMGISNWQSWHNAAIAAIGFTLEDAGMVNHAINGKSGIHFQMKHSVLPDGFWYEGTASYHFYALNALQKQAMAMRLAGMNLYQDPTFQSLYKAPLDYAFPDGTFPVVNDSDTISISNQAAYYEIAFAWYGRPEYATIAQAGNRGSLEAFLWGAEALPAITKTLAASRNFPGLGAVMLRQDGQTTNPMALHLDYGPHGGAHGHNDKLGIILFANGRDIMPDPGRLAYAAPLHKKWYKTTLAHNTVIVDGKNQEPAEGTLVSTQFKGPIKLVTAACDTANKDVVLTRSVALAPEYMLDVVSGLSPKAHTWDLAYHAYGKLRTNFPMTPKTLKQKKNGYQVLKNVRSAQVSGRSWGVWVEDVANKTEGLTLVQGDTGPREIIFADGVAGGSVTTCPVVLSRQSGTEPVWISLVNPNPDSNISLECSRIGNGWAVTVTSGARVDRYETADGMLSIK